MDAPGFDRYMTGYANRKQDLLLKLSVVARNVIPVLKDHNLLNTAAELERLFFEYDANEQEMSQMVEQNPQAFVDALLANLRKPPG